MLDELTRTLICGTAVVGVCLTLACSKGAAPDRETTQQVEPELGERAAEGAQQPDTERSFELLGVSEGLLPRHADAVPLLEKVACIPAMEPGKEPSCNTQRVYRDGDLYMLTGDATKTWFHLGKLEPGTPEKLETLFAELCEGEDPVMGNDNGRFIYRVTSDECTREFVVVGFPQGTLERIGSVADIINGSIQQGTSEASKAAEPANAQKP